MTKASFALAQRVRVINPESRFHNDTGRIIRIDPKGLDLPYPIQVELMLDVGTRIVPFHQDELEAL